MPKYGIDDDDDDDDDNIIGKNMYQLLY